MLYVSCSLHYLGFYAVSLAESLFLGDMRICLWVYQLMGGDWSRVPNWVSFWLRTGVTAQVESM